VVVARISAAQREVVRRALLQSAAQHFAAHGLRGANINRISLDAGFAKGTVYNYFRSKEELFEAVLSVGSEETLRRYRVQPVEGGTREKLRALMAADASLVREHEAFMQTFVRELVVPRPETDALIAAGMAPLVEEAVRIIAAGQDAGELRGDLSASRLAQVLLGLLTMAYVQNWRSNGHWPGWAELPDVVVAMFIDGAQLQR
jgi:AcrR family transcriptional regulator